MAPKKIRVLVVDDSATIRALLKEIITSDPELEVVATAPDPYVAREKIIQLQPDVITLDIEMPRMDGVTFLEKLMQFMPIPTVIISSLAQTGSEMAMRAFAAGAIDIVAKPVLDAHINIKTQSLEIIEKIKVAAQARVSKMKASGHRSSETMPKKKSSLAKTTQHLIAIASSTGGTEALKVLLPMLPADLPGTVIVQHMPPVFTKAFAQTLNELCPFEVKEAEDGDAVVCGRALLAPGNFHMEVVRSGAYYRVKLHQQPLIHGVRPAADYLFESVAKFAGANAIGVVLTGMGKDGAKGLKSMRACGAYNIAQDEKSCVVYGMPKAAVEMGAVDKVLSLEKIGAEVMRRSKELFEALKKAS